MKKNQGITLLGLVLVFVIFANNSFAQSRAYRYWSFGANAGANIFIGDIKRYTYLPSTEDPSEFKIAYGLTVDKKFSPVFGLRGQLLNGQLAGADPVVTEKIFEAKVLEYNLSAVFNLNNLFSSNKKTRKLELFGLAGIGFSNWETDRYLFSDPDVHVDGSGQSAGGGISGRTTETVVPFGLEVDYHLNRDWTIKGEYTFHPVYSDLLDMREADFAYDMYNYAALGISYKLYPRSKQQEEPSPQRRETEPTEEMIAREQQEPTREETQPPPRKQQPVKPAPDVTIGTQMAQQVANGEAFGMTINVNKQHLTGSTEILQTFPSGFTPVKTSGTKGNFKFEEQMLTLAWDEVPESSSFQTAYNVEVKNAIPGKYLIPGMMIYRYDSKSHSVKFRNYITVKRAVEEISREPEPEPESTAPAALEYRVQIRAKKTGRMSKNDLAKRFNLSVPIKEDIYNGYYIYTVGSFETYEQARNYRDTLRKRHSVNDAFVVVFRDGERLNQLPG